MQASALRQVMARIENGRKSGAFKLLQLYTLKLSTSPHLLSCCSIGGFCFPNDQICVCARYQKCVHCTSVSIHTPYVCVCILQCGGANM